MILYEVLFPRGLHRLGQRVVKSLVYTTFCYFRTCKHFCSDVNKLVWLDFQHTGCTKYCTEFPFKLTRVGVIGNFEPQPPLIPVNVFPWYFDSLPIFGICEWLLFKKGGTGAKTKSGKRQWGKQHAVQWMCITSARNETWVMKNDCFYGHCGTLCCGVSKCMAKNHVPKRKVGMVMKRRLITVDEA